MQNHFINVNIILQIICVKDMMSKLVGECETLAVGMVSSIDYNNG